MLKERKEKVVMLCKIKSNNIIKGKTTLKGKRRNKITKKNENKFQ